MNGIVSRKSKASCFSSTCGPKGCIVQSVTIIVSKSTLLTID